MKKIIYLIIFLILVNVVYANFINDTSLALTIYNYTTGNLFDKDDVNLTLDWYNVEYGGTYIFRQINITDIDNGTFAPWFDGINLSFGVEYYLNVTIDGHSMPSRAKFIEYNTNDTDYFNGSLASDYILKTWLVGSDNVSVESGVVSINKTFSGWDTDSSDDITTGGGTITGNLLINGILTIIGEYFEVNVTKQLLNGSFIPTITNIFTIGNSSRLWSAGYFTTVYQGVNAVLDVSGFNAENITGGTLDDAVIPSGITRDTELGNTTIVRKENTSWILENQRDDNCSVDNSCPLIAYESELGTYVNSSDNCSVANSCPLIAYEAELGDYVNKSDIDSESELEGILTDVTNFYTADDDNATIATIKVTNATHADTASSALSYTETDPIWVANRPDYLNTTKGYNKTQVDDNFTTVKGYIDTQDSAQDECNEVTNCVPDAWDADDDIDDDEINESKINFSTTCAAGNHYYLSGNDLACEADDDTTYNADEIWLYEISNIFYYNRSYVDTQYYNKTYDFIEETELDDLSELNTQLTDAVLVDTGTMTDAKWCKYVSASTDIQCNVDPVTDTTISNETTRVGLIIGTYIPNNITTHAATKHGNTTAEIQGQFSSSDNISISSGVISFNKTCEDITGGVGLCDGTDDTSTFTNGTDISPNIANASTYTSNWQTNITDNSIWTGIIYLAGQFVNSTIELKTYFDSLYYLQSQINTIGEMETIWGISNIYDADNDNASLKLLKVANSTHSDTSSSAYDLSCTNCIGGTEISELADGDISNTLTCSALTDDDTYALVAGETFTGVIYSSKDINTSGSVNASAFYDDGVLLVDTDTHNTTKDVQNAVNITNNYYDIKVLNSSDVTCTGCVIDSEVADDITITSTKPMNTTKDFNVNNMVNITVSDGNLSTTGLIVGGFVFWIDDGGNLIIG